MSWVGASDPRLFQLRVNQCNKGSLMGRAVWEGSPLTGGEMAGDTGRTCFSTMRSGRCTPGSAGSRSQVWMKSLVGCLTTTFPHSHLSPYRTASLFIELPQTSFALWQAEPWFEYVCEKTYKVYKVFVPPPLKGNAYPFKVLVRSGIKQSLGSLCRKAGKREKFGKTEKMQLAKLISR